ncbi:PqiC family protein [Noviherbaspirillum pedocola]|uniref:Membrane integrity-associated transporter subunit PqiC n=1 Tax=Noviherbaspirillum pedocola TaxID=2801341 RepID=A0A934SXQ0_9BURK|nr:PqiC family protein [Noviherbaspirillum pedocola]MBK4738465.1 membrane integrity-associated transporter subunit PqiC [Noviherbaspirillum pedocola]
MNRIIAICAGLVLGVALSVALSGCGSSPPQRFYTFDAPNPAEPAATAHAAYSVSIGPVMVPALVDRPQLVLSTWPNRVQLAEQSRWAEPLKDGIPRVIAADLAQLLPGANVTPYTQAAISHPDYRVQLDVRQFESAPGSAASIDALWVVNVEKDGRQITGRTVQREAVSGNDDEALVAAHQRALQAVSRDIAQAIAGVKVAR